MPVSMLITKIESSQIEATTATSPSPTTIASSASAIGTNPATTEPKTSRRIKNAAGRPNWSSPLLRSCWERSVKSWSRTSLPVTPTSKPARPSARSTIRSISLMSLVLPTLKVISVACRSEETSVRSPVV